MSTLLIVDDMKTVREQYKYDIQRKTDYEAITASNGKEALDLLESEDVDLIILDLEMPVMDGLELLEILAGNGPFDIPVIVYTAQGNFQRCVRAVQLGAFNFYDKNEVNLDQLIQFIENALEQRRLTLENKLLREESGKHSPLLGSSKIMNELRGHISKVAGVPSNILIAGESGTGKELVAREIHRLSDRSDQPFIAVNCAALPENLVESELFGYDKGAFSGANKATKGKFEVANGGILFLDEIGDMPLSVQAKLLRVLQQNEVTRLGAEGRVVEIDVRVIAATHQHLETSMEEGRFRDDLYYRICTHIINVPPLRERKSDIEELAEHFVQNTCQRFGIQRLRLHTATVNALKSYDWKKNNIRELQNIIERMVIQCEQEEILPTHLPWEFSGNQTPGTFEEGQSFQDLKYKAERQIITQALEAHDWHITNTAKSLDISNHSNLLKIMRRLDIERSEEE